MRVRYAYRRISAASGSSVSEGVENIESKLAAVPVVDTKEQSEVTIRQCRREAETGLKDRNVAAIGCHEMCPHKVMRQMEPLCSSRSPQVGHSTPLPLGPRKDQLEFQGNGMRREYLMRIYGEQVCKWCGKPSLWRNALEARGTWQRGCSMAQ